MMDKLKGLIPYFLKTKTKVDDGYDVDTIAREIKDNDIALKMYKMDIIGFMLLIIEAKSNAKYAFNHKNLEVQNNWVPVINKYEGRIQKIIKKMEKVNTRYNIEYKDVDCDIGEIYADISGSYVYLLDENLAGDEVVEDRKKEMAMAFFGGDTGRVERQKTLSERCHKRILNSEMNKVCWIENDYANPNEIREMRDVFDFMATQKIKQCTQHGNIITFPGAYFGKN